MPNLPPELRTAAERALAYLGATDPLPSSAVGAIMGFGVFDLRLPAFCGELYLRGLAPRLIFSGGIGAGTGNLGGPEARVWRAALQRTHPSIPESALILEDRSTNTSENIAFTSALLARDHPELGFGAGLRDLIMVASPSRLRRVRLTAEKHLPTVRCHRLLPPFSFASEWELYTAQGIDYLDHLAGELDRIVAYPTRGWIAAEPLPAEIAAAHAALRGAVAR